MFYYSCSVIGANIFHYIDSYLPSVNTDQLRKSLLGRAQTPYTAETIELFDPSIGRDKKRFGCEAHLREVEAQF